VQQWLKRFIDGIEAKCAKLEELFSVQRLSNARTQDFYRILRWCLTPASINHLLRTVPPDDIRPHARRFDDIMYRFLVSILRVNIDDSTVNPATAAGDLIAARARLSAAAGGLGVTSAASTSFAAFLGSLCLTAHYAKQALGVAPADAARLAVAFPQLAAAVTGGIFATVPNLAGKTLADIANEPFWHVQRKLTREVNKTAFDDVYARTVDPQAKAWLFSGQSDGATFLLSYPEFGGGLNDAQFVALVKARLGLQIVDGCDAPTQCPACSGLKANGNTTLSPAVTVLRPDGTHVLHCREPGEGGAMGMWSSRHAHLKFSVVDVIKRLGPQAAVVHGSKGSEPYPADYGYQLTREAADALAAARIRAPDAKPLRADIAVTINGVTTILDTVISHPHAAHEPRVATTPGFAANAAYLQKDTLYSKTYDIPSGHMVPLSAETGGRLHASFKTYMKDVVTAGLAVGGAAEPVWTPMTRAQFSSRLRTAFVTINIAIARSVANALIRGSTVIARYAPMAHGPHGAAHAARAGA
jgi:hypothetical protein